MPATSKLDRDALADCLNLPRVCHAAYLEANDSTRRLFNQAFFTKDLFDEHDETRERTVRVDCNQPFDDLLSRLVPAHVHHELALHKTQPKTTAHRFARRAVQVASC